MAYTVTSKSPTLIRNVGTTHSPTLSTGVTTLSGGAATVTIPLARRIIAAFVNPGSANVTYVSATSTNVITIAGNGTDTVSWLAVWE